METIQMYTIMVIHTMGYSLVTRIEQSEAEKLWEQVKDRPETLAAFFFDSFGYQRYTFTTELFETSKGQRPAKKEERQPTSMETQISSQSPPETAKKTSAKRRTK